MRVGGSILLALATCLAPGGCERSPASRLPEKPGTPAPTRTVAEFLPSRDGFAFRNQFPGTPFPGVVISSAKGQSSFGLCGGMSAAAADYFLAGFAPSRTTSVPASGSPLYEYFFLRQAESLGPGLTTAFKFADLTSKSDREVAEASRAEVDALEASLKDRAIAPLGLILARTGGPAGANRVDQNHQVLALGLTRERERALIRVYDPNFPGDDGIVIDLDFTTQAGPIGLHRRSNGKTSPVRGILLVPYAPRTPPARTDQ